MKNKIVNTLELEKAIDRLRKSERPSKLVQCHGVFDLFHVGHLRHMRFAKSQGDILIVSITKDKFINKGTGKPVFNEDLRAELISSIEHVDYVYVSESQTAIDVINLVKPNIYCKGIEYKNKQNDLTKKIDLEIIHKGRKIRI